ncbi:MAG: hypothetical protein K0S23_3508 [Fluviicola sp.]|jgi:hypothetical protein|uniref:hypothetical protein n=1 Tax=Fluviicola sp. TaxID=1917219 RepID=UPI002629AAB2|nr:hypothetical protein [Fluviicola sp.]MDF3029201.1 hypothetical protein [Fluviicola sp.]
MRSFNPKTLFIPLICLFIGLQFSGCKPAPKPVTEDEAYALLNELIIDDTLVMREIYYRFAGLALSDEMKKEFTPEEVEFMEAQIRKPLAKELKPQTISWFHKNYKPDQDFVKPVYEADSGFVTHMSFPIISPDRKKMLIHWTNDCNCMLGGSAGDHLYVKKNGRWKLAKTFNGWVS